MVPVIIEALYDDAPARTEFHQRATRIAPGGFGGFQDAPRADVYFLRGDRVEKQKLWESIYPRFAPAPE